MPLSHAEIEFVRDVKPILEHNCVSCHREGNAKGKVRLDTKKAAFAGDDVIVPGKPDDSSLYWTTILPSDDELVMPPFKHEDKDYPLRDQEKEILKKWIFKNANSSDFAISWAASSSEPSSTIIISWGRIVFLEIDPRQS